jgi:hypothetical protein
MVVLGQQGNRPTSAPSGFGGSPQQGLPSVGGRPRVRARRGQATDPHSIAERVCVVLQSGLCHFSD